MISHNIFQGLKSHGKEPFPPIFVDAKEEGKVSWKIFLHVIFTTKLSEM